MPEGYYHIGKVYKKFSFRGELFIRIRKEISNLITEHEPVFLLMEDTPVPFFIEKLTWKNDEVVRVKFEDVDDEHQAQALLGKEVYIPLDRLPERKGNNFYENEILGYRVTDTKEGDLGIVVHVNTSTPQTLLEVEDENGVLLIPAEAFIRKIDRKNKHIEVELPGGLTDLRR